MGIGIALGGVASGLETAEKLRLARKELDQRAQTIAADTGLRTRALDIQEKQEGRLANQDLLSQADKIIGDQLKIVGEVMKAGKEAGHTPEQIAAAIEPIMADVDRLSARVGRDSKVYRNQVTTSLQAPGEGTPEEKGTKSANEKVAERDALVASGVPKQDADVAAGLSQRMSAFDRMLLGSNIDGTAQESALAFEPDQSKRVLGKVYDLPNGKQALWTRDPSGKIGWEFLN